MVRSGPLIGTERSTQLTLDPSAALSQDLAWPQDAHLDAVRDATLNAVRGRRLAAHDLRVLDRRERDDGRLHSLRPVQ